MTSLVDGLSGDISRQGNSGHTRAIRGLKAKKGQQKDMKARQRANRSVCPSQRPLRLPQADSEFSAFQALISNDNCI